MSNVPSVEAEEEFYESVTSILDELETSQGRVKAAATEMRVLAQRLQETARRNRGSNNSPAALSLSSLWGSVASGLLRGAQGTHLSRMRGLLERPTATTQSIDKPSKSSEAVDEYAGLYVSKLYQLDRDLG